MNQLISIIGTRPQYIKLKPIYDYCNQQKTPHHVIDTGQHYEPKMSGEIMADLGLNIDVAAILPYDDKIAWISNTIHSLKEQLEKYNAPRVLIYGDTDSAFCAALVCNKLGIRFGHIEAGARCGNRAVPEEVNRMYLDSVADVNFCTAPKNVDVLDNGLLVGDLEYELLNQFDPTISYGDYAVMTMHRKENMNFARVQQVFDFVATLEINVSLMSHHSLVKKPWFSDIKISNNLSVGCPLPYTQMVNRLAGCKYILTDSGSIPKTAPFFGKRCLVLRNEVGWRETVESGHSKISSGLDAHDKEWLEIPIERVKDFYLPVTSSPSRIIVDTIAQQ